MFLTFYVCVSKVSALCVSTVVCHSPLSSPSVSMYCTLYTYVHLSSLLVFCCKQQVNDSHHLAGGSQRWRTAATADILEAAVDDRRQAAVDVEEQRPQLQGIFEAAIDGNHV